MKKARPRKGLGTNRTSVHHQNSTPHGTSVSSPTRRKTQQIPPTTMEKQTNQAQTDQHHTEQEMELQEVEPQEIPDATPDELREQLRELTQKNCLAALQEIEQILERRGLRMYPIVHVEGNAVIHSTIAIVPK